MIKVVFYLTNWWWSPIPTSLYSINEIFKKKHIVLFVCCGFWERHCFTPVYLNVHWKKIRASQYWHVRKRELINYQLWFTLIHSQSIYWHIDQRKNDNHHFLFFLLTIITWSDQFPVNTYICTLSLSIHI